MTSMCKIHVVALAALAIGCSKSEGATSTAAPPSPSAAPGTTIAPLSVTSTAFAANAAMPAKYTCEGENTSPPLAWSDPPASAKSVAIVVDDPDAPDPAAPKQVFVHWVIYDVPPATKSLAEGQKNAPAGARDGKNDFGSAGWSGPCPPIGRHRYFHKVYALDVVLPDLGLATKADLVGAMNGHVVAQGELVGTYQKAH
jgi:hypothetical protein